jgi:hypothetical protein
MQTRAMGGAMGRAMDRAMIMSAVALLITCQALPAPSPMVGGADGSPCETANDCRSGICEGACDGRGICQPQQRSCSDDGTYFCPCEGGEIGTRRSCPGHRGSPRPDGGTCQRIHGSLEDDAPCEFSAQCQSGICIGGCGVGEGRCSARDRICGTVMTIHHTCDGVQYGSSDTCPRQRGPTTSRGSRFSPATLAVGALCELGSQCASGVCEGGCGLREGTCRPRDRWCAKDVRTHVRCDGTRFEASSTCPGVRTHTDRR